MAAKATVPVEALRFIKRFRGHGPLLHGSWMRHPLWEWAELL
jgi:hypothetical protein